MKTERETSVQCRVGAGVMAELLLANKVRINSKDSHARTALH
jgi:hypothetical protein